ncbi:hypothetical protein Q1695_008425 [Nippostrongylus brasiliensis]|nr:hypothetical protein Q1695_008425 [Nippostrongylus brasiliensis]
MNDDATTPQQHLIPYLTVAAGPLAFTLFDSPDNRASVLQLFLASASENATVSDLLSRYGHGQGLLLQGGLSRLVKALAENQDIQLGEEVTAIEEAGSLVVLKTTNGSYSAKQVIVTVPPSLTTSIVFTPPLPIEYEEFIESYKPTGRAFYFTMTFASPFWRGNGKNGQIIHTNPHGPILWLTTFDVGSPTMCSGQGQTGVLWGIAHPVDDSDSDSQARLASYTQIVMRSLGDNGTEPLDVREEHFSKDPYSRGSIAVLPPRVTVDGLRYLQGVNFHGKRVVFASAEYSNSSMGLMNGAVLSGQKAGAIVGLRLRSAEEPDREGNDIANMIRLNDEILQTQRPQEESVEPKQTLSDVQSEDFVYNTSTQYPSTTPFESTTYKHFSFDNVNDDMSSTLSNEIQHEASGMEADLEANEASGENVGVISSSERSSFIYKTSTQYPPTTPFETSTLQHFSFGNAPTVAPFVPPPPSTDVSVSTAPPTTTTVRTTFTTPDPLRTTTPFMYSTSTIDPPFELLETTTFKHFSFGNDENALPTMQKDPTAPAPKEELINRLRNIAQEAPNYSTIQLATKLSALVENLLLSMQEEQDARRI